MKPQRYIHVAVTVICLAISAIALANTNLDGAIRFAKSALPFLPQNTEREIEQERPSPKDPIELTQIKVHGKAVRLKEKFAEDNEWIKKTVLKIKNRYSKPISYIQVNVDFPETATSGIMLQQQFFLGRHPVNGEPRNQQPLGLMPNDSLDFSLAIDFDSIKEMIERRHSPIGFISKIKIRLRDVAFEDGTVYTAGAFFKRNPDINSPRKWIQIEK